MERRRREKSSGHRFGVQKAYLWGGFQGSCASLPEVNRIPIIIINMPVEGAMTQIRLLDPLQPCLLLIYAVQEVLNVLSFSWFCWLSPVFTRPACTLGRMHVYKRSTRLFVMIAFAQPYGPASCLPIYPVLEILTSPRLSANNDRSVLLSVYASARSPSPAAKEVKNIFGTRLRYHYTAN